MVTLWVKYVFPSILIDSDFDIISVKKQSKLSRNKLRNSGGQKHYFLKKINFFRIIRIC